MTFPLPPLAELGWPAKIIEYRGVRWSTSKLRHASHDGFRITACAYGFIVTVDCSEAEPLRRKMVDDAEDHAAFCVKLGVECDKLIEHARMLAKEATP